MSDNVLHLGISIPINYMIGSRPVSALYSGQTKIWPPKKPVAFVKAEGSWTMAVNVFTSNAISHSQSTIEKVYFKNLGGKVITINYDVDSETSFDYLTIFALDSETETIATSKANGTANGPYGMVGSVDFTFPDNEEHFICLKYSKDGGDSRGRDNAIVTFPQELFGEVNWIVVGEVIRYEYENESNALYKCVYQDLQSSFNGVLTDIHKDGELISKELIPTTIISPNDTIKLDDVSYGFWVPEVDPNKVYNLSFDSPSLIVFGNSIKISSWSMTSHYGLKEIRGLNFVDTSNVTDMSGMFDSCWYLTSLNLSNWVTSNVTNMRSMFKKCQALRQLDVSGWNTSNVTNMNYMFNECNVLTSLNGLSGWDVSKVTSMESMFYYDKELRQLDVSGWNTSNVTNMSGMFSSCTKLASLNLSNWVTSNVTNMRSMFSHCSGLTSLDVSGWNTSKVTSMENMFYNCGALRQLNLSNWVTSNVTSMSYMFDRCQALTSLNLSNWDTSNVTNMSYMFDGCPKLTTIIGPIIGISANIDLSVCPLTHDSAMVFMNGLNTVTETKTITFKSTTYETLTEAEIAAATAKGWTIQSAA